MVRIYDEHELNQLMWWSNWSRLVWLTKNCCVLLSNDFDEPLFNHSEVLSPKVSSKLLSHVEVEFQSKGLPPCFFVKEAFEYESIRKFLSKRGYEEKDHLSFMEIAFPSFKSNKSVKVNLIGRDEIDTWCETYLLAFYGDNDLSEPVLKSVKRALMDRKTRFMLARYKDLPVGTLALYETRRFSGAYCVGTIPKFRNIGIASTMLEFAYSLSRKKGKKLVLQTFISDSVESFYLKRGFRRIYLKSVLIKN